MNVKTSSSTSVAKTCDIISVGKRRDGGTRYWCLRHRADATAKYGKLAEECRYASVEAPSQNEIKKITLSDYAEGVALWGAVPAVYDTSRLPVDRGIHVHARKPGAALKEIDKTFRKLILKATPQDKRSYEISELDSIYYMISSVFGFAMKNVECKNCGYSHLDKDWFSLHPHHRHLCSGCGSYFRDSEDAVGNPLIGVQNALGHKHVAPEPSQRALDIRQEEYPGGIQIWGSNPSIFWTAEKPEEEGIHVHLLDDKGEIIDSMDETYASVQIDGVQLDPVHVRTLMAQNIIPHLRDRIDAFVCDSCGQDHFCSGKDAFTPNDVHKCSACGSNFRSPGRKRKMISNPLIRQLAILTEKAPRTPQQFDLGLLPETI